MTNLALPANLPDVGSARLPQRYEAAKTALSECERIDECQDWADKMAAMASYARQAEDEALFTMVQRIRARAIRRCGELLSLVEPKRGANQNIGTDSGTNVLTRKAAAEQAGLTKRQRDTALRVASIPAEEFELIVEGDNEISIEDLAKRGTKKRPEQTLIRGLSQKDFALFCDGLAALSHLARVVPTVNPAMMLRTFHDENRADVQKQLAVVRPWLDALTAGLKGNN